MTYFVQLSLFFLGIIVLAGGIFGFFKAKSKASLIAGVISGALLVTSYSVSLRNPKVGFLLGLIICSLLTAVFLIRLAKTKKFMPSGMLLILTSVEEILLLIAYFLLA